ncbi:MAG: Gx transporter family protein [Lachnospiraceae bacterium]|jgi:heptaprenyl diphosphate synthase|nr:Gx transporter family protein [Lachnospiraceae bacterium]
MKSKKTALYGLLVALAFILSYIETLIPFPLMPGIKLGLANLVVITALYGMGWKEAFVLSLIRILLVGFTFGNLSTMLYSLAGGLLSWLMMVLAKKIKWFSMVGVSIIGGISHNIGQIIVAILTVSNVYLITYLPLLLITGVITGALIGFLGALIVKRIKRLF